MLGGRLGWDPGWLGAGLKAMPELAEPPRVGPPCARLRWLVPAAVRGPG